MFLRSVLVSAVFAITAQAETQPFNVEFEVSVQSGTKTFVIEVHPDWAPNGARRFKELVESGFYDKCKFFRVVKDFMVQWGISGKSSVTKTWREKTIPDDPVRENNHRGYVTFAKKDTKNSRTTQIFINYGNNEMLDEQDFAPFGKVVSGMDVVDDIYPVGEGAPQGPGPSQHLIEEQGNKYLKKSFPKLSYIKKATVKPLEGAPLVASKNLVIKKQTPEEAKKEYQDMINDFCKDNVDAFPCHGVKFKLDEAGISKKEKDKRVKQMNDFRKKGSNDAAIKDNDRMHVTWCGQPENADKVSCKRFMRAYEKRKKDEL